MAITTTIPTNLDFPNRGVLERDAFVLAQETAQDLLAGGYTTALNQYAVELNATQTDINTKAEQVANQAVTGGYSQTYINATFTPKILNTQTDKATPIDADLIPLSDSASSFVLKKLSWANIKATLISSFGVLISGLTAKTTPADADMIVIADSASSNASKKLTWANIKAALKTYFDTLYMALTGNQTIDGVKTFNLSPIVPSPTTGTQAVNKDYADLKVALTQFTGTNQSLAASGYQKLPGGLILQWGAVTYSNIANINILFPITFPTQCFSVTSSTGDLDQEIVEFITVLSNSSFTARFKRISGTTPDAGTVYWFAIGY